MGRKKTLPEGAEQVAVYLSPEEQLVLEVIRMRRKKRGDQRTKTSEIVVDSLWRTLIEVEKVSVPAIKALMGVSGVDVALAKMKLRVLPKPDKS